MDAAAVAGLHDTSPTTGLFPLYPLEIWDYVREKYHLDIMVAAS